MEKLFFKKLKTLSQHIPLLLLFALGTQIKCKQSFINDHPDQLFSEITSLEKKTTLKVPASGKTRIPKKDKKSWTFVVYMAADNDLRSFAARNIKQLAEIGSNQYINILVHIDIKVAGNNKITRRYYVEKDKVIHVNANDPQTQQMDSGDPKTLISCCNWAFNNYPADDYALILWNHGTGACDPVRGRVFNPVDLFSFNPLLKKFELDRTSGFIDLIEGKTTYRGICWDDTTGNYLTNKKLELALKTITQNILKGKKLSIVGFDACLMSMIEVGNLLAPYANIMCGSQEVELGTGWDYSKVLAPFLRGAMNKEELAQNIVTMYAQCYSLITNDFTQSAINLGSLKELESIVNNIALLLSEALQKQSLNSVKKALWLSHSKAHCTSFDEPSYKDIHHFFCNLQKNLGLFQLIKKEDERIIKNSLNVLLEEGKLAIEKTVLINRAGKNLSKAKGLSIYLPETKIHTSYQLTNFATTNEWYTFLQNYIST